MIPTELEFGAVTMQVLFRQLMEDAVVPALQQGVEALGRVDVLAVDVDVNLCRVVYRRVTASERCPDASIGREIVCHDLGGRIDVDKDVLAKRILRHVLNVFNPHVAIALDQDGNRGLVRSAPAFALPLESRLAADVGFIGFHGLAIRAERRFVGRQLHRKADTMGKMPSRLDLDTEFTGNLKRADAFLAAGHQVKRHQPFRERQVRIFKNRADPNRVLLPALFALVKPRSARFLRFRFRRQLVRFFALAMRADRAIRPELRFDEFAGFRLIGEKVRQGRKIQKSVDVVGHC